MIESPGENLNSRLWLKNPTLRDDGTITIGTVFVLKGVLPVTKNFEGVVPIIESRRQAIILKAKVDTFFKTTHIDHSLQEKNQRFYYYKKVNIEMKRIEAEKIECNGKFCDGQNIDLVKKSKRGCGCYCQANRCPCVTLIYSMNAVATRPDDIFRQPIVKFSSRNFNRIFLSGDFPTNVQYSDLEDSDTFYEMKEHIRFCIDHINKNGGFDIWGWYKKGVIEDSATKSSGEGEQVVSGELVLHTVTIDARKEIPELRKFNVNLLTDSIL